MLKLVKMDFYRLLHSKALKVGIIVSAIIAFVGMLFNLAILEIVKMGMAEDPNSVADIGVIFPIVSWLNGVDFADVVFTGTSAFSLFISCMVVASFIGAEQSCGYIKNIAGQLSNRGMTVASKFIVTCFIQLIVLLVYTIISSVCGALFFGSYINAYSMGALVEGLLLRFLLFCAINAVLLFFCTFTKSHAVAMVIGAIFGIGVTSLVYMGITALLGMLNLNANVALIMPDGINGLICVANLGNIAVRAIILAIVFIAGFLTSAIILFKKRDVK